MACVSYTPEDAVKYLSSCSFRGLKNCPDYNYIPGLRIKNQDLRIYSVINAQKVSYFQISASLRQIHSKISITAGGR